MLHRCPRCRLQFEVPAEATQPVCRGCGQVTERDEREPRPLYENEGVITDRFVKPAGLDV